MPPNFKGRGRPPHMPTAKTWLKVNAMWAFGSTNADCAKALGITEPTFNRHYFKKSAHKAARDESMLRLKAERLAKLIQLMRDDNVPATKELGRLIEQHDLRMLPKPAPMEPKLGKKQAAFDEAPTAHENTSWASILNSEKLN